MDGSTGYHAQIAVQRDGVARRETKTFDRWPAAAAWIERREHEFQQPGALQVSKVQDPPLGEAMAELAALRARSADRRQVCSVALARRCHSDGPTLCLLAELSAFLACGWPPAGLADVPQPFLQGPRDVMRELRDLARRQTEDTGLIAECVRIIREESRRQTEIPSLIEREQAIKNRPHERDRDGCVLKQWRPSARDPERTSGPAPSQVRCSLASDIAGMVRFLPQSRD